MIRDTAAIPRQVLERVESVEVIDRKVSNRLRLSEPQIYCSAPSSLFVDRTRTPRHHAAAGRTEMKLDRLASHVDLSRAGEMDAFAFEVINPQHAVATTECAVARCR